jgi:pilus assembly protein CpaE
MKTVVRLALVDPVEHSRNNLKNLLVGIDSVWLEAECSKYDVFGDVVLQTQPDIALVSLDSDPTKALSIVAKLSQEVPTCAMLVLSSSSEGSLILQAMRNGAKEFLALPLRLEDLLSALDRIQSSSGSRREDGQVRSSQIVTVAGVSGGVGCTSLAINLACILASNPKNSVAIIDMDFALGDADVWLDIIPEYTIQDVAENITRLDYALLKRSLTKHSCGVFLLPRPVHFDDKFKISADNLRRVVALLKATFTHLVIDVSKGFTPLEMTVMEVSDTVLLTTQLDLPCLRNVVRMLQFFDARESIAKKVKVVVNRLGLEDSQISLTKALETIGRDVAWQIPNDYGTMVEARNNGVPLIVQAPRAKITRSIEGLATTIDPTMAQLRPEVDEKKKPGLFGFLSKGAKAAK